MVTYSELLLFLRQNGYHEADTLSQPGAFYVRGDLIYCWPVSSSSHYRLHFFGEDLEKIEEQVGEVWKSITEVPDLLPNHLATEHGTVHPGEYVVHPFHGVGIFNGVVTEKTVDGGEQQYIALLYAGNDRLLVPLAKQGELMPYIGSRHPRLTRLYSKSWAATKARVQRDLIRVARGLLSIYAARQVHTRPTFPIAKDWLQELDQNVDFALTADQERSLQEILTDLSKSSHPMDRLLCGDVGFGKTEVALRAAAVVLAAGKQVAFIAPTTILVEQHYKLLQERFTTLPVRLEHLSRLTGRENTVLAKLAEGTVDLVVGTHRLLSKATQYANLGLLIIDEEQKFGVAQKEQLKALRPHLDTLSLSATPIPRTLSMSLSGLRGLSLLRTPPQGRLAVQTTVADYSDAQFAQALRAELERGGQIYVVHNRVQTLAAIEARVRKLTAGSGAKVATVHGQQRGDEIAAAMAQFIQGEMQILVASSIVEHGLDCPNANTLVVLHSEWFGLSDLYQLRGRVGRRSKQAYAYFFANGIEQVPYENEQLRLVSENARLRLQALQEADVLGSGWGIALRDLEIRGGGNILGNEQHGSMEAIGLLLYSQLLQEEVGRQAREQGISLFSKSSSVD